MSFRLRASETVLQSVQRIAREQVDKAIAEIEDSELGTHETVHQLRKRCKKLRGLVRLVRGVFDAYQEENRWYRDAARTLSYVRDAQSTVVTHDELIDHFTDQLEVDSFQPIRERLVRRRDRIVEDHVAIDERLDQFRASMREGKTRIFTWQLNDDGFEAISAGLKKAYRRGRKIMQQARKELTTSARHEWRKRVKYHWYHLRLLTPLWPEVIKERRNEAKRLADYLGDDHDLAVLADVTDHDDADGETMQAYYALIRSRRLELQRQCDLPGSRLYCEQRQSFAGRYEDYWNSWQRAHRSEA